MSRREQAWAQLEPMYRRSAFGLARETLNPDNMLPNLGQVAQRFASFLGDPFADQMPTANAQSSTATPKTKPDEKTDHSSQIPRSVPKAELPDVVHRKLPGAWSEYHAAPAAAPIQVSIDDHGRVTASNREGASFPARAGYQVDQGTDDGVDRRVHEFVAASDAQMQGKDPGAADALFRAMSPAEQRLALAARQRNFPLMQERLHEKQLYEQEQERRANAALGLEAEGVRQQMLDEAASRRILQGKTPDQWVEERAREYAEDILDAGLKGRPGRKDPAARARFGLPPEPLREEAIAAAAEARDRARKELSSLILRATFPNQIYARESIPIHQD